MTHVGELDDADCRACELFLTNELDWPTVIDRTGDFVIPTDTCSELLDRLQARRSAIDRQGISIDSGGLAVLLGGLRRSVDAGADLLGFGD